LQQRQRTISASKLTQRLEQIKSLANPPATPATME